jgi:hypothetical protein
MNIITAGFARALNKLADGRLSEDYVFAVPENDLKYFLGLLRNAIAGQFLKSVEGKTYEHYTGTDITITIGYPSPTDILIPVHFTTMKLMIEKLG